MKIPDQDKVQNERPALPQDGTEMGAKDAATDFWKPTRISCLAVPPASDESEEITWRDELLRAKDTTLRAQREVIDGKKAEIKRIAQELAARTTTIAERDAEIRRRTEELMEKNRTINDLNRNLAARSKQLDDQSSELGVSETKIPSSNRITKRLPRIIVGQLKS